MLSDRGILKQKGKLLTVDTDAAIAVPESVQALIAARLDTLSPEHKALLHDASVAGKVFWSGAVAAIGSTPDAPVRQGLHELGAKELVRASRTSSMEGHQEYCVLACPHKRCVIRPDTKSSTSKQTPSHGGLDREHGRKARRSCRGSRLPLLDRFGSGSSIGVAGPRRPDCARSSLPCACW